MRLISLALAVALSLPGLAQAHEFWIKPEAYVVGEAEDLIAGLWVGQEFGGREQAYIPARFEQFTMVQGDQVIDVKSKIGSRPAMAETLPGPGLWTLVHQTKAERLVYTDAETFVDFVTHKDLDDTLAEHERRRLPPFGFAELYTRFAKSLVAAGVAEGADREIGLLTEIVAEANPYAAGFDNVMRVQVLFEGSPRADAQVEIFDRAPDGSVAITTTRTNGEGRAEITVSPGHEYLIDAVKMVPLPGDSLEADAVWHSLWASLTFKVPG